MVASGASQPFPAVGISLSQALSPSWGSSPSRVKEQQQPKFKGTFPKLDDVCFHNWKLLPCTTVVKTNFWFCMCVDNTVPEHSPAVGKAACADSAKFQRCQVVIQEHLGSQAGIRSNVGAWGCSLTLKQSSLGEQNPCWMGPPSLFQTSSHRDVYKARQ